MFLIMAVGYFCKRVGLLREGQVSSFNTIAFRVFMPCLVFYNLYSSDLSSAVRPRLVVFTVCAIFAVYAAATAAMSFTAVSSAVGRRKPRARNSSPAAAPKISGLVRIFTTVFFTGTRFP